MKIAIAGASGFVGRALSERLARDPSFDVKPLGRSLQPPCDLFSLLDVEGALRGQEQAVYLVHSMLPSSQLSQGNFADYDLVLADNFARAARKNGIKRIIYLGGIVPAAPGSDGTELSLHLRSRLEVEEIFKSYGLPLLALRAGMVMGAEGSSFQLLINLVRRLPVMICPAWTRKRTSPIHVRDVAESFYHALKHPDLVGELDLQGPRSVTYVEMLELAAKRLGRRRAFFDVPIFSPGLSKLWVRMITGAPKSLVYPLVDSLRHDMRPNRGHVLMLPEWKYTTFEETLDEVATELAKHEGLPRPKAYARPVMARHQHVVQSVQRHELPPGKTAEWASLEYIRWLHDGLASVLTVKTEGERTRFFIRGTGRALLELTLSKDRSDGNRILFYITGGALDAGSLRGRLEFRVTPDGRSLVTAIHDFRPRLPWYLYKYSQALIHHSVMRRFGDHLKEMAKGTSTAPAR